MGFGLRVRLCPGAVGVGFEFRWMGSGECCRGFGDVVIRDAQLTAFFRFLRLFFVIDVFLYKLTCCYFYVNCDQNKGSVLFCSVMF